MNKQFDVDGREIPDDTPVAVPLRFRGGRERIDMIKQAIREVLSDQAAASGHETFAEADDFNVPEDDGDLPITQYEVHQMQEDASFEEFTSPAVPAKVKTPNNRSNEGGKPKQRGAEGQRHGENSERGTEEHRKRDQHGDRLRGRSSEARGRGRDSEDFSEESDGLSDSSDDA